MKHTQEQQDPSDIYTEINQYQERIPLEFHHLPWLTSDIVYNQIQIERDLKKAGRIRVNDKLEQTKAKSNQSI
jgi:hypothetical protein